MGKLNFRKEAVITQLWHAEGAFKKFGLHIPQNDALRKAEIAANSKLSYIVCSSEGVRKIYAEAFGADEKNVLPLGAPRVDYLLNEENKIKALEEIHEKYPHTQNKKILLYAPTFRDEPERDKEILKNFNISAVREALKEEYEIFIRLHPQIHISDRDTVGATDVTDFSDVRKLILASDVLVTDYSSICMDFSLLSKKTVFFAYDLDWYTERRDFYFDYENFVPGLVAKSTEELINAVKADFQSERNEKFRSFNFSYTDSFSAKRVVDTICK
jgi:CDP-ribitol ribitolphosphotransferase